MFALQLWLERWNWGEAVTLHGCKLCKHRENSRHWENQKILVVVNGTGRSVVFYRSPWHDICLFLFLL